MDINELFQKDSNVKDKPTRGHTLKWKKPGCIRDSGKFLFYHSVVGSWNSLDKEMVNAPNISAFNGRLDKHQDKQGWALHGLIH